MRATVVLGTRPEVIKLAPVVRGLIEAGITARVVHTGQHTDATLATDLESECSLEVAERWQLPTQGAKRIAAIFEHALGEFETHSTDVAIVLGDTWTVPLVGLAARSAGVAVVHVEAGLRSHNERSQEEVNRTSAVAFASLHCAPTQYAADALKQQGVASTRIAVTGNPVTDALRSTGIARVARSPRSGVLFTAHRATNVDDPQRLRGIVETVERLRMEIGEVIFPLHPRTAARLEEFTLIERLRRAANVVAPLKYQSLLTTLAGSRLVVTDSGGLQEEAAWFGVPAIVLRASTPRPEGVLLGFAALTGVDPSSVISAAHAMTSAEHLLRLSLLPCPYGDGHTAPRIAGAIQTAFDAGLLTLTEPTLVSSAQRAAA